MTLKTFTADYSLNPQLTYLGAKAGVGISESCSKKDKITYGRGKIVNIILFMR